MDGFQPAAWHVENFQDAADVILVRNEILPGRLDDAHVAEDGLFDHVAGMRAEVQAGVHLVTQVQAGELAGHERLAVTRGGKNVSGSFPLELEDIGIGNGQGDLPGHGSPAAPELERGQAPAVPGAVRVRGVRVETGTRHPADFAMLHGARAGEFRAGAQEKIPFHFFPGELKFVAAKPHIGAGAGQGIFLPGGVVTGRAGKFGGTDIGVPGEFAQRICLRKRGPGRGG